MNKKNETIKMSAGLKLFAVFSLLALLVFAGCNKEVDDDFGVGANQYQAAIPTFCPPAGELAPGTPVHLATTTEGAAIYFTTDGSEPGAANGKLYSDAGDASKPIITGSNGDEITVRAIAVRSGMSDSPIGVCVYTINIDKSALPTAKKDSKYKESDGDTEVDFTLTSGVDGTWKVYDSDGASTISTTVKVSYDPAGKTLTISSINGITPIEPGTYYITVTEEGKEESGTLALTVLPPPAIINMGNLSLSSGSGWEFDQTTHGYTITGNGDYLVRGDNSLMDPRSFLSVTAPKAAITLDNVSITTPYNDPPLSIGVDSEATVLLSGENTLTTTKNYHPGVFVPDGARIIIESAEESGSAEGALTAKGGYSGAGIGGADYSTDSGYIEIRGGTITADEEGYGCGAGIGGGAAGTENFGGSGGTIIISGGVVNAIGSGRGAGIGAGGAGSGAKGGTITINGGIVNATGGGIGAGIGSGRFLTDNTTSITINGGTVNAAAKIGSGIGDSHCDGWGGTITINGGTVNATSESGRGIGGENFTGTITITGGTVTAHGSSGYAGIGGSGDTGGTITISGGTINATGEGGAGIGGDQGSAGGTIRIYNGSSGTATGGSYPNPQLGYSYAVGPGANWVGGDGGTFNGVSGAWPLTPDGAGGNMTWTWNSASGLPAKP